MGDAAAVPSARGVLADHSAAGARLAERGVTPGDAGE
jgi:hypothetical protein